MSSELSGGTEVTTQMQNENWISLAEAAVYIGVSKETIRNWIKNSQILAHKVGRLWKFKKTEIDTWISTEGE